MGVVSGEWGVGGGGGGGGGGENRVIIFLAFCSFEEYQNTLGRKSFKFYSLADAT